MQLKFYESKMKCKPSLDKRTSLVRKETQSKNFEHISKPGPCENRLLRYRPGILPVGQVSLDPCLSRDKTKISVIMDVLIDLA